MTRPDRDEEFSRLRVPPHSTEAEQSVLGGLLLDNTAWDRVGDLLLEADFYRFEHRIIYAALGAMINALKPADVITVFEKLQTLGKADECGGLAYLNALATSVPSAANIRRYAEIVRERAILRRLAAAADQICASAFNTQGKPVSEIVDEAERSVLGVAEDRERGGKTGENMDRLVVLAIDRLNELHENGPQDVVGTPTGFFDLDRMTTGFQPGDLIVLAARPSMGKTSLALNIGEHIAIQQGLPLVVFSMEMGASSLTLRMMSSVGKINHQHLRTGRLSDEEWGRVSSTTEMLGKCAIHIDDRPALSPNEMRAAARRQARELGPLGLIVVDYLQLMSSGTGNHGRGSRSENRATEVAEFTRSLKALAREMKCPVIALSQLSRNLESRPDKRPILSDLRESGAIEQDADTILFIYRDEYYTKDACREPGVAEVIVGKQRNGPVGTIKLTFLKWLTKFENLAPETDPLPGSAPPVHVRLPYKDAGFE